MQKGPSHTAKRKSPARPDLSFSVYSHSKLLLWDLYLHSRFEVGTCKTVEVHDILSAYARIVLCYAVE